MMDRAQTIKFIIKQEVITVQCKLHDDESHETHLSLKHFSSLDI